MTIRRVDKMNGIICGNNAEVMACFPDNFINLTLASPPYDELREYNGYKLNLKGLIRQLFRCTEQGGVVVWVVADQTINGSETGSSFKQALSFMHRGFNLHDTMIYRRKTAPLTKKRYEPEFEYMFVFTKGKIKKFNPIKVPCKHKGKTYSGFRAKNRQSHQWTEKPVKKMRIKGNIWEYAVGRSDTGHPAPFPEALARDHIISWSNAGDLVFDPFLGSGTTAKMAVETGRNYLGIDISEEYCQLARRRVAGANRPLFAP